MFPAAEFIARVNKPGNAFTMVWRNTAVTCFSRQELIELLTTTIESQMSPPDVVLYWDEKNSCSLHSVLEFLPQGPLVEQYRRDNPTASATIIRDNKFSAPLKPLTAVPTLGNTALIEKTVNRVKRWFGNDAR